MLNYIPKLELVEFLKVYPDIIPTIDREDINKFVNLFKKQPNEENNISSRRSLIYSFSNSKGLLKVDNKDDSDKLSSIRKSISFKKKQVLLKNEFCPNSNDNILLISYKDRKNNVIYNQKKKELKNNKKLQINNKNISNNEQNVKEKEAEIEEDYYLINKGILLQNNKKRRTIDVKKSLELFLLQSYFFEKISSNLNLLSSKIKNSKKLINKKEELLSAQEMESKIKNKLKIIVKKLSEKLLIKKYPKDQFVVKMNEIGRDCYFLVSGKVSILKPVEYKGMKLNYHDYLIYLKCLLNLDEIDLVLKVLSINRKILDISNIDEVSKLIRAFFLLSLKTELNKIVGGITLEEIENFFNSYHFSLEEFQLNKNKIQKDIEEMEENHNKNAGLILSEYIAEKIPLTSEDIFILELYKLSSLEDRKKINLVTLYKYELFIFLYPGSFFGDAALEKAVKRRNATIRTEEDCFICSLGNEYYSTLLSEENKKLKSLDLIFLSNNFFFNGVSPLIFNRYYYPMFKCIEKNKNDIIYKQNDIASSVFLVKEGMVKLEIFASAIDLFNLIQELIKNIFLKNKNFKINLEKIMELKNNYLYDEKINNFKSKNIFSKVNNKINLDLYISEGYECLGIQEFCFKMKYITTCKIISKKAVLMEIKKEDLFHIINNEIDILQNYYKFVFTKLLLLIKRLHYIKRSVLNTLENKYDMKRFNIFMEKEIEKNSNKNSLININMQGSNNHKQKIEVLNNEKVKSICQEKINSEANNINSKINDNSNSISLTDRNYFPFKQKCLSSKNLSTFRENNIKNTSYYKLINHLKLNPNNKNKKLYNTNLFLIRKENSPVRNNEIMNTTMSFSQNKSNKYKEEMFDNNDNNINLINNEIINTNHGYISIKKFKKNIFKKYKENGDVMKLNFVKKFKCSKDDDKSIIEDFSFSFKNGRENNILNKFIDMKNQLIKNKENNNSLINKEEIEINNNLYKKNVLDNKDKNTNKSSLYINTKEDKISNNNISNQDKDENKKVISYFSKNSFPDIKNKNLKLKNLIFIMKQRYAISNGQKKFIYYRRSKKNKAINLIEEKNNSYRQKSIGQTIKDYYFKKKIQGYSSLINPKNNTYINRQKTIKIKKIYE